MDISNPKVLVLGHKGMLGHMVAKRLSDYYEIQTIDARYPTTEFKQAIDSSDADYLINCIGAIPQRTDNFEINYTLPEFLDKFFKGNIVHPGTDCEMDDDDYGISKRRGRAYIVNSGTRTKILKTSIIGPELDSTASLLEWFLNSKDTVGGYTKAMWNGVTTYEWANQCINLIQSWDEYTVESIIEGTCLSKYDLLLLVKDVFDVETEVDPNDKVEIDKCLVGHIQAPPIKQQLIELKQYYYGNN